MRLAPTKKFFVSRKGGIILHFDKIFANTCKYFQILRKLYLYFLQSVRGRLTVTAKFYFSSDLVFSMKTYFRVQSSIPGNRENFSEYDTNFYLIFSCEISFKRISENFF